MDDIDRRLISLLRDNGRASVASLAKQLRVAREIGRASCRERVYR